MDFDKHSDDYVEKTNDAIGLPGVEQDLFMKAKAAHLKAELRRRGKKIEQLSLLDVGCGIGSLENELAGDFGHVCGIDISERSLQHAEASHPDVEFKHYDGGRIPYPDKSFDVAVAICVMHHVPPGDWSNFATEMVRTLKPGGIAFVFEHNPYNPVTRLVVSRCEFDADAVLLSKNKVRELFAAAHAKVTGGRYILFLPMVNRFARWVDNVFRALPLGAQYFVTAERTAESSKFSGD